MLLATYQPLKKSKKENCAFKELKSLLGYYPVFCFSADTPQEAIAGSILSMPACPEVLYFVDTDKYDYIDIVKWCLYLKTGDKQYLKDALNNECSPIYREYLIRKELLKDPLCIKDVLMGEIEIDFVDNSENGEEAETVSLLREIYQKLIVCANVHILNSATGKNSVSVENTLRKKAFEIYLIGLFAHISNPSSISQGIYTFNSKAVPMRTENIRMRLSNFCNPEEAEIYTTYEYYKNLREMVESLLTNVFWDPETGRNGLCPCGSGKKYKKCHGQYL